MEGKMTEGMEGRYQPMMIDQGALMELRDVAGPPPVQGKKWVMINLDTGELKWYRAARRRSYGGGGGYRSRGYGRRRY